jgi:hypothetical protein
MSIEENKEIALGLIEALNVRENQLALLAQRGIHRAAGALPIGRRLLEQSGLPSISAVDGIVDLGSQQHQPCRDVEVDEQAHGCPEAAVGQAATGEV